MTDTKSVFISSELCRRMKKIILFFAVAAGLLIAVYIWYSRPLTPGNLTNGNDVQAVGISCDTITFASTVSSDYGSIFTRDAEQIKAVTDLLKQYPVNRKVDWSGLTQNGVPSYPAGNSSIVCVRVSIHYKENGSWNTVDYDISSEGTLALVDSNGIILPCSIGRFGKNQTGLLFQTFRQFYNQNREDPRWKDF